MYASRHAFKMDGFWFLFKEIFLHFVEFQVQSFVIITVYTGPSLTLSWKKGLTPPFTVPRMESTVIRLLTRDYNQRPPTTLRSSAIQTIRQSSYFWAKIPFYFSYLYYLTIRLHIFTPFSLIFFSWTRKKIYKILIPEKIMRHKNAKFKSFLWKSEKRIAQKDEKRVSFIPLSLFLRGQAADSGVSPFVRMCVKYLSSHGFMNKRKE